jgi:integrase
VEIQASFATGNADTLLLARGEAAIYRAALASLKPLGVRLDIAARDFADATGKLVGGSLAEAVAFFTKRNPATRPRKTVPEVVAELIAAKEADGAGAVYLRDMKRRLDRFAEAFQCALLDLTAPDLNAFLRNVGSGRNRNNYRSLIGTLFKYAVTAGYLSKDHIDFKDSVARASEGQMEIEIFTPEQMVKLLDAAQVNANDLEPGWNTRYATNQGLLPFLLLGGFAGLRTAEIQRQLWSDINLERGFIRVTAAKGNTAQKRLVPISDNLRQWLIPCMRQDGLCCEYGRLPEAIARLSKRSGVAWKHNALRHSFISYKVALTQNIPQVSLEAGNSVGMVNRHYREIVRPDEAKAWFAISPQISENVVPMGAVSRSMS